MNCPHCEKPIAYPFYAERSVTQNNTSCIVATQCCGKAIKLTPIRYVLIDKSDAIGTDDWGNSN